jgi:hypothetical protein
MEMNIQTKGAANIQRAGTQNERNSPQFLLVYLKNLLGSLYG